MIWIRPLLDEQKYKYLFLTEINNAITSKKKHLIAIGRERNIVQCSYSTYYYLLMKGNHVPRLAAGM